MTAEATFDCDTALAPSTGSALRASISERWRAAGGPHGGYLAALMLRGLTTAQRDASRAPLTLTVQFLRAADVPVATAQATFSAEISGIEFDELPMPDVEAPWKDRRSLTSDQAPRFAHNLVLQPRYGLPFEERPDPMVAGGWIGFPDRRPLDALALALFSDGWFSPPYVRLGGFVPSPTVTLSVYFRARLPRVLAEADELCLARFETKLVRDGSFHSSGAIWARDGTVLAETHQLQLLLKG